MAKRNIIIIGVIFVGLFLLLGALVSGGNDVTIADITFHLPNGFDADNPIEAYTEDASSDYSLGGNYEGASYKNNETGEMITIAVAGPITNTERVATWLTYAGFEEKSIDGKDGYFAIDSGDAYYYYIEGDNLIMLNVASGKHSDNSDSYEKIISEIIK